MRINEYKHHLKFHLESYFFELMTEDLRAQIKYHVSKMAKNFLPTFKEVLVDFDRHTNVVTVHTLYVDDAATKDIVACIVPSKVVLY